MHANSANMLSLHQGFFTFNSASLVYPPKRYKGGDTTMRGLSNKHEFVYLARE